MRFAYCRCGRQLAKEHTCITQTNSHLQPNAIAQMTSQLAANARTLREQVTGCESQTDAENTRHNPVMATAVALTTASATLLLDLVERALHGSRVEWLFFRELRVGTGRRNANLQRLDAFALNSLPHTGMKRVCYEVKVSRSDFLLT